MQNIQERLNSLTNHYKMHKAHLKAADLRQVSAANRDSQKREQPKIPNKNNLKNFKVLSQVADGKWIEGRMYSREEFGKLSLKQRGICIRSQHKSRVQSKNDNNPGISSITREQFQDNMVTLRKAMVASSFSI